MRCHRLRTGCGNDSFRLGHVKPRQGETSQAKPTEPSEPTEPFEPTPKPRAAASEQRPAWGSCGWGWSGLVGFGWLVRGCGRLLVGTEGVSDGLGGFAVFLGAGKMGSGRSVSRCSCGACELAYQIDDGGRFGFFGLCVAGGRVVFGVSTCVSLFAFLCLSGRPVSCFFCRRVVPGG
jgi:hypothetical protein